MKEKVLNATHQGDLKIGDKIIECAVLEDGTRVITQTGFLKALGRSTRPAGGQGASVEKLPAFVAPNNLKPFINNELNDSMKPIIFKPRTYGYKGKAFGYKAEILPEVCYVYLDARKAKALLKSQYHMVDAAEIIIRGLAMVGIIALVDEATGYQEVRDRKALQKILELYIAKELKPWVKTFPDEFYERLFKLKNWQFKPLSVQRPRIVGKITNDIIYERMEHGVLKELQKITPKDRTGRRKQHLHRRLTDDIGHPKLKEHISNVITLMRASSSYDNFYRLLQRALPKRGHTFELRFPNEEK